MPTLEEERLALEATTDFRAAADIGLRVAALRPAPEGASALALLAFGKAESAGLTVHTDSDRYLAVKKEEAHIRFLDGDYAKAQNALSFFAAWQKDIPGWVRMYRCAINIQQLPQLYAQAPDMMFSELDAIEETDTENVSRRNANILAFFDKLVEWKNGGEVVEVQARPFLERAVRFGLGREDATRAFCDAFEPTFELPKEPKPSDPEWQHLLDELADVKEKLGRAEGTIVTLRARNERQSETLKNWSIQNQLLHEQNSSLQTRNRILADENSDLRKVLPAADSSTDKKRIEELNETINRLEASLAESEKYQQEFSEEEKKSRDRADALERSLAEKEQALVRAEGINLGNQSRIEELTRQLELAKTKTEQSAIVDSENGVQDESRRTMVEQTLAGRRILVIGDTNGHRREMLESVKPFGFAEDDFEWRDDYVKLTNWAGNPTSGTYCGIIYGTAPHSMATNDGGYSSLLAKLRQRQGLGVPKVVEMRNSNGRLESSQTAFGKALDTLWKALLGVA